MPMRAALWLIGLFAMAVALALFAGENQGTVTVFWPPHRIDVSVNLALLLLVGLFVLLLVGVMLLAEGGHIAHLAFFGYPVEPMAKSTFYFVVGALIIVDIIQGRYQKKIMAEEKRPH